MPYSVSFIMETDGLDEHHLVNKQLYFASEELAKDFIDFLSSEFSKRVATVFDISNVTQNQKYLDFSDFAIYKGHAIRINMNKFDVKEYSDQPVIYQLTVKPNDYKDRNTIIAIDNFADRTIAEKVFNLINLHSSNYMSIFRKRTVINKQNFEFSVSFVKSFPDLAEGIRKLPD